MIDEQEGRAIVNGVAAQYPALLQTNTATSCFQFITQVLKALHALGHTDWGYCGKTGGEGQYQPPQGFPRQVGPYLLTGVSHDAIASPTQRIDTLGSGNDGERPIYHKATAPFWSFDPADGSRIVASPQWTEIPPEHWRASNPVVAFPLAAGPVTPPAPPATPATAPLSQDEAMSALRELNAFYASGDGLQRPGGMVIDVDGVPTADLPAMGQWFYQLVVRRVSLDSIKQQIRGSGEWKAKH